MGLFERIMGGEPASTNEPKEVVLYYSPTCIECHAAQEFFAAHGITVIERDVTDAAVRERMSRDLGRVATPAIIIGKQVFWGFEENREDIADLLGVARDPLPR